MVQKVSKRLKAKRVIASTYFIATQNQVIKYGAEQFGYALALTLDKEIEKRTQ